MFVENALINFLENQCKPVPFEVRSNLKRLQKAALISEKENAIPSYKVGLSPWEEAGQKVLIGAGIVGSVFIGVKVIVANVFGWLLPP